MTRNRPSGLPWDARTDDVGVRMGAPCIDLLVCPPEVLP